MRIKILDGENGIFRFLDAIDIAVPRNLLMWHGEDIDAPGVIAAIMHGYTERNSSEVAYILVGDVSGDGTEPKISSMTEEQRLTLDEQLETGTRHFCEDNGIRFVRWTGSKLNFRNNTNILVSGYIVDMDGAGHQQRITARFTKNNRKWFVETAFAVELADRLAKPMFLALHPVAILDTKQIYPI